MNSKVKLMVSIFSIIISFPADAACTAKAFAEVSEVDDNIIHLEFSARPNKCPNNGCWGVIQYRLEYHNKYGISGKTERIQTRWEAKDDHFVDWKRKVILPVEECSRVFKGACEIDEVKIIYSDCEDNVE